MKQSTVDKLRMAAEACWKARGACLDAAQAAEADMKEEKEAKR